MGLFDALDIAGTGLSAERLRMDVTTENLANAQSVGYRRKDVVVQPARRAQSSRATLDSGSAPARGVAVAAITQDAAPNRSVYDPANPAADAKGYVTMPNVDTVTEMVDLISASRGYEANVTAMQTAKQMFAKTLDLLR